MIVSLKNNDIVGCAINHRVGKHLTQFFLVQTQTVGSAGLVFQPKTVSAVIDLNHGGLCLWRKAQMHRAVFDKAGRTGESFGLFAPVSCLFLRQANHVV